MATLNNKEVLGYIQHTDREFSIFTRSATGGVTDSLQIQFTVDTEEQAQALIDLFGSIFRAKVAEV